MSILLNDPQSETAFLAFEDILPPGGDKDYNDLICKVAVSPYTAVDRGHHEVAFNAANLPSGV
jgi:hypothetical protein